MIEDKDRTKKSAADVVDSLVNRGLILPDYRELAIEELDRELRRSVRKLIITMSGVAVTEVALFREQLLQD